MKKKDLIFTAVIIGVIGLFIFLSVIGKKPTPMTVRPEHTGLTRQTPNQDCLACHALTSAVAPMPENHPKKGRAEDQRTPCTECHKLPDQSGPGMAAFSSKKTEANSLWQNRHRR
jgi:hypothetical protein